MSWTARFCGRAASTARFTSTCPTSNGREQILRVHAKKINLAENVDLSVIARGTPGLSGADLANLLNEAALLAARRGKKKVEMADVEDAREKVQFGRERRRLMDDEEKKLTAYHEAGHALVQAVLDDGEMPVHKVTIIPRGRSLGSTMFIPKKDMLTHAKKRHANADRNGRSAAGWPRSWSWATSPAAPPATSSRSPRSPATWSATGE